MNINRDDILYSMKYDMEKEMQQLVHKHQSWY